MPPTREHSHADIGTDITELKGIKGKVVLYLPPSLYPHDAEWLYSQRVSGDANKRNEKAVGRQGGLP